MRGAQEGLPPKPGSWVVVAAGRVVWGEGWGGGLDLRATAAFPATSLPQSFMFFTSSPHPMRRLPWAPPCSLPIPLFLLLCTGRLGCRRGAPDLCPPPTPAPREGRRWGDRGGQRRTGLEDELPGLLCVGLQAGTAPPPKAAVLPDRRSLRFRGAAPWSLPQTWGCSYSCKPLPSILWGLPELFPTIAAPVGTLSDTHSSLLSRTATPWSPGDPRTEQGATLITCSAQRPACIHSESRKCWG